MEAEAPAIGKLGVNEVEEHEGLQTITQSGGADYPADGAVLIAARAFDDGTSCFHKIRSCKATARPRS